MDVAVLSVVAFAVGTAGNLLKALPQFLRTAVRGHVAGLSPAGVWLAFTANVLWMSFGVSIADWRFVALNFVGTVLTGGILVRFVRRVGLKTNTRLALYAAAACSAFVAAGALGHALLLEAVGAAFGVVISMPQLLHLWRMRDTSDDVSGVSPGEYLVVIVAQIGWTTYWLLQAHPLAAAGAAWGGVARLATYGLLRRQSRRVAVSTP